MIKKPWDAASSSNREVYSNKILAKETRKILNKQSKWTPLFLGRNSRTNVSSILRSSDITLLTKVSIVRAMILQVQFSSVHFSRIYMQPNWLSHSRLPCPSPTPRACSNSCPLSEWCYPTISSSVISFSCLQSPSIRVFSKKSVLHNRWTKYWNFNFTISYSNEYSGLISFRMD